MKRRTFIWTPLLLSLGVSSKLNAQAASIIDQQTKANYQPLLQRFRDSSDAAEVGRHYLADKPQLANIERLTRDLGLAPLDTSNENTQAENVINQFEGAKQHDFTVGNTVCIEGWVLSKAEASLCALAYLSSINA